MKGCLLCVENPLQLPFCCLPLRSLTTTVPRRNPNKTRRVDSLVGSWEAVKTRNVIPLTADCHRQLCRGHMTEQFKSVWRKFNPHYSPSPICRLIYSQVHSTAVSEEAQRTNLENMQATSMINSNHVTVLWLRVVLVLPCSFSRYLMECDSYQGKKSAALSQHVMLFLKLFF